MYLDELSLDFVNKQLNWCQLSAEVSEKEDYPCSLTLANTLSDDVNDDVHFVNVVPIRVKKGNEAGYASGTNILSQIKGRYSPHNITHWFGDHTYMSISILAIMLYF